MNFAEPIWLVVGLVACGSLWWLYRRFDRKQQAALATFVSPHLVAQLTPSVSPRRRTLKHGLVVVGVAFLFVALARPQAGYRWEETHRKGLDILFAVDTSKSMLTQDVKPDRLTRAKMAVSDLVDKLDGAGAGDDVGLIAFAGDAFVQSPLTLDYSAFHEALDALDTSTIPRGGTDIARAIGEAQAAFNTENDHDKILVLLTDGEDLEGNAVSAAEAAAKDGVKIFTVGVGSANGDLIPVPNDNGGTDFLRDASGQFVKSHLDETMLKKIAAATGGMYQPLGQRGEGLATIYNQGLASFQRHDISSREQRVALEQFQWPLLAALGCFLAEFLIGSRKRQRKVVQAPLSTNTIRFVQRKRRIATPAAVAALLAIVVWPNFVKASPQSAEKEYQKGDYAAAAQQYQAAAMKAPGKTELDFNIGSAAYKAGMYDEAAKAFQKSLTTDQLGLQQETYYNLGNTQYRLGQANQKTNPQQTIPVWKQAVESYQAALQLKPGDTDAQYNLDLVKKKLEQLQQQQQQQKKQQQQNKDNKDQKNQDQKNQSQNGQNSKPQDQKNQDQSKQDQNGQGQNSQNQNNQSQNGQNQNRQNQAKQDQSGQNQKNQAQQQADQQSNPAQAKADAQKADQTKPDAAKDQSAQQNKPGEQPSSQQPTSPKPNGQGQAGGQAKTDGSPDSSQVQPVPGQMTPEEAKALLNSVKDDEHRLPAAPIARNQPNDDNTPPAKDW